MFSFCTHPDAICAPLAPATLSVAKPLPEAGWGWVISAYAICGRAKKTVKGYYSLYYILTCYYIL